MEKIVVEVSNPNGTFRDYKSFDTKEISIGRSFINDLIIHDPYVSPRHLLISTNGNGWIVEDTESKNGMFVNSNIKGVKKSNITSGDEIVIGKTRLRIFSSIHNVGEARSLDPKNRFMRLMYFAKYSWTLLLANFVVFVIDGHLTSSENLSFNKLVTTPIILVIGIVIWSGIWAFVGKLIKQKSYFYAQTSISSLFLLLTMVSGIINSYIGYMVSSEILSSVCSTIIFAIYFSFLLIQNLSISTDLTRKKQIIFSFIITLIIVSMGTLTYFSNKNDFNPKPGFYSVLKPINFRLTKSKSVDSFLKVSRKVFTKDSS